jgi:hypothetical protein
VQVFEIRELGVSPTFFINNTQDPPSRMFSPGSKTSVKLSVISPENLLQRWFNYLPMKRKKIKNKWINSTNLKLGRYTAWENVKGDI